MVERTPVLDIARHLILMPGRLLVCLPIYFVFVTGTLTQQQVLTVPMPWLPGDQLPDQHRDGLAEGRFRPAVLQLACRRRSGIVVGKIAVSLLAAFAVTYFRFPFRMTAFWLIFVSLMLPIEVRIVPTYESAANAALPFNTLVEWLGLEQLWRQVSGHGEPHGGMVAREHLCRAHLPLIASATATFLFRQFFLTVPEELCEAARVDGARPDADSSG